MYFPFLRSPERVELVERPAGQVVHEHGVGRDVDERVPRGRRVAHKHGRLQAGAPVDEHGLALVHAFDLTDRSGDRRGRGSIESD